MPFLIGLLFTLLNVISAGGEVGRSSLYPADWTPPDGGSFLHDAFLQDLSYAGYHRGEEALPDVAAPVFRAEDHGADPDGQIDSTAAIQAATDAAANAGGVVVTLGEGTFLVAPVETVNTALVISSSNVVLRGAGAFSVGEWIVVRADATTAFIEDRRMTDF